MTWDLPAIVSPGDIIPSMGWNQFISSLESSVPGRLGVTRGALVYGSGVATEPVEVLASSAGIILPMLTHAADGIPQWVAAPVAPTTFDAGAVISGVLDLARIPDAISRDAERVAAITALGLAVDANGNVFLRTDGSGHSSVHLSTAGGGYAYVDPSLSNDLFDSVAGQIRYGGADNNPNAGWYIALQAATDQRRSEIPADVHQTRWIRIDNDILVNVGGSPTARLNNIVLRGGSGIGDALYGIDPQASDAQAVDDQGGTKDTFYIYTPEQLASVVAVHQSPTHSLPHLTMLPTPNVGDLALLDHDYTQGNRQDAEVTFNTLGAIFHGWSDGSVFGRSGTTNRNLSPLQFIRLQYNGSVYTAGQISSTNQSWITRLNKYVSDSTEYDLGPVTTLNGHFVRAIISGPNSANISTQVDINLKFTDGTYWLTDGTVIIWPRGEYLWNYDTGAYAHYDGWLGLTVRDHSSNAFSGIKELRLHQSLKDFSIPGDSESLGLEISTAWLQPKIAERVKEYARLGSTSRVPLSDTYVNSVVGGSFDDTSRALILPRADGGAFTITIPGGGGGGGGGDDAFPWATEGNTDILPGSKLPSDVENVDNSNITYIDATVSSFASRVAQLTTRTGIDSIQGNSYQFQWVDSDQTADKRIAIQVNGGTIRTVVFQDGAGLRRVALGDLARYNIIQIYRGSGSYHFTGGTREAASAGSSLSDATPEQTAAAGEAGTSTDASRDDHVHQDRGTGGGGGGVDQTARDAAAAAQTVADAAATEVQFDAHAANASAHHVKTPAGGSGVDQTARDAAAAAQTDADANTAAITALPPPRSLSNATPVQSGTTGTPGTSAIVSRRDHRHQGDGGGGGGGDDAYPWATEGNNDEMPRNKLFNDTLVGVTTGGGQIVFENAGGLYLPFPYDGGGGGGDDAFDWATEGDTDRIPIAKMAGNLLHTIVTVNRLLRITEVDGTQHNIVINTPPASSVTEAMLAMHNVPTNAQVIGWDQSNDRMVWVNAATDQRIVDLINDHNPTATPGAVTQTGGGDRGSGPKFSWEDHTHQIVGIQLDDIPGTPITTVPNDALLLVETSGGINRKITGANARTSLGGGGGVVDIDGLAWLAGNITNADVLVVYDDSTGANRKIAMPGIGAYASRISGFITTTATPADADYFYFGDGSDSDNMKRVTGTNLKTYIGGDLGQVTENTRVVEHILDRLADFDQRVSDIDQTSVTDTLAFVTTVNMKVNTTEPTDADRTTGTYGVNITSLTIGPNETGYVIFRIGIDDQPNLFEPQLYDTNNIIIQNLTSLGFATELSETAGHRYFYLPLHFPIEDIGTLRLRVTTRTTRHNWLGEIEGVQKRTELFDGTHVFTDTMRMVDPVIVKPASGLIEFMVNAPATQRVGSARFKPDWIPTRTTILTGTVNDGTTNLAKFEMANRRLYMNWVTVGGEDRLSMAAQAGDTYNMVVTHLA